MFTFPEASIYFFPIPKNNNKTKAKKSPPNYMYLFVSFFILFFFFSPEWERGPRAIPDLPATTYSEYFFKISVVLYINILPCSRSVSQRSLSPSATEHLSKCHPRVTCPTSVIVRRLNVLNEREEGKCLKTTLI